ncbi:hypothetical protein MGH68_18290 [Erysipelothrix sp. D19-032]
MSFDVTTFPHQLGHDAYRYFGAHLVEGGVVFRVYAPSAAKVSLAGAFNGWNYYQDWMHRINDLGVYELFVAVSVSGPSTNLVFLTIKGPMSKNRILTAFIMN